ncbi:MAG: penicillin-binding protein activator [Desulfurococcales archaeon]|nr:penicillin-binding protein activator [Desulfurococcales archaeon]
MSRSRKKGTSTGTVIAAIIIIIIIAGLALYLGKSGGGGTTTTSSIPPTSTSATQSSSQTTTTQQKLEIVKIGALLPLTGDLQSFGKSNQISLKQAENDINAWLKDQGANFRIEVEVVDSQTDPTVAVQQFDTLYQEGIRYFIGPMSSGELSQIVSIIQQGEEAVVISQSSTAPSLAIKDTVYRFPPPDELQGKALADLYKADGVTHIVIAYRNDDWGSGLAGFVEKYFKEDGGTVANKIPYDPKASNFDNLVQSIASAVQNLEQEGVSADKIGVELISFDEASQILATASNYNVLKQVKWYGSDGTALSQGVAQNPDAAEFAVTVHWKNTITFGLTNKTGKVFCEIKKQLGYTPDPYSLIAYDALWVMTMAIKEAGGPHATPSAVAAKIPDVVKTYEGVTGKIVLNQYGDRKYSDYAIFEIVKENGKYQWKLTEIYKFEQHKFEKITENPLKCS